MRLMFTLCVMNYIKDKMMADAFRQTQVGGGGGGGGGGQYYSSSSVMQYSSSGGGAPKVYSASSSVMQGPGGVSCTLVLTL